MFVFASMTDGVANLVQNAKGHVYTWPTEKIAREFFKVCKCEAHLYQVRMDLHAAWLVKRGDHRAMIGSPQSFLLDEDQKRAIYDSYVYKSLLEWTPLEQTLEVES
jgi:hypothetical protein